ncbi:MAG: hypothetical protein KatS3mg009_0109 [Acidimicrobiia bacterium]|nr:MAG: hypothetical protein KatS3mg009_0109 [Acidimicrobiia bacterium]
MTGRPVRPGGTARLAFGPPAAAHGTGGRCAVHAYGALRGGTAGHDRPGGTGATGAPAAGRGAIVVGPRGTG